MADDSTDDDVEAIITAAYPRLLVYARLVTGNRWSAEDVVQEALVRCLRRRRRVEIRDFIPYVRRAIAHEAIRSAQRRKKQPPPDAIGTIHPQDAVIAQQTLRQWLSELPPRQRVAVVSRYYLDLSEKETAFLMSCTVSAVKALCHRGLTHLNAVATSGSGNSYLAMRIEQPLPESRSR